MKRIFLLSLAVFALTIVSAQNRKVNLLSNIPFEKAAQMAKKENKLLFLDFGSPRCSPCLYMKNKIFTIDSVADFVNSHFISVDYMEGAEKTRLSQIYGVYTEPVFLIVDPEGNLMHRTEGRCTAGEMLERFRQGLDRENNLAAQSRDYKNGRRDPDFILSYLNTLHIAGLREEKQAVLKNIFSDNFPLDSLKKPSYWNVYEKFDESATSRQTLFVMDHFQEFIDLFGEKNVYSKIDQLYGSKARIYIFGKSAPIEDPDFLTVLKYAQKSDNPNASIWLTYLVPAQYKFSDWVEMAKAVESAMSFNILKGTSRNLYKKSMSEQLAWYCNDVNALQYSIKWIDELIPQVDNEMKQSLLYTKNEVIEKIKVLNK
jgi:hypothetical protein